MECDKVCVDLKTDLDHCGQCDVLCEVGSECMAGLCIVPVVGVSLDAILLDLATGATQQLLATVIPAQATNKALIWSSSHPQIATIDENGVVEGISPGQAQISVQTVDGGYFATCMVNVKILVSGVDISLAELLLSPGQTTHLHAAVKPATACNQSLTWQSSNSQVATVDGNGVVTAKADGQASVTVTTVDGGFQASCLVTVVTIQVTGVVLMPGEIHVGRGAEYALTAVVSPADASNKTVVWYSSNPAVASISQDGVVTGVEKGSATIMVITGDGGFHDTGTVHVQISVERVDLYLDALYMEQGDYGTIFFRIFPDDATNKTVIWESSDPSIATITDSGIVTACNVGVTTITVTSVDGSHTDSLQMFVWL